MIPEFTIPSSLPPMSTDWGAHSVSSMDEPLSSRSVTDRLDVSDPSRFMMVARSPTACTTATMSTIDPAWIWSTSAILRNW